MPALVVSDLTPVVGLRGVYREHAMGSGASQTAPRGVLVAYVAFLLFGAVVAGDSSEGAHDVLGALVSWALKLARERAQLRIGGWTFGWRSLKATQRMVHEVV